ncbi:Tetratricopeptide TPR_2 repeat protein [Mesorhizobium prunaredense]|uniref:Tetratricopeptide TPR_2 repeat protein n=1 Tax=Mesorhizobium prunaredense TaxID=1631249 RepID=A0A1R3V6M4_9HYPH|nr:tetratricopeptide repeat protein [Mesorhizobium prunaredense]SIT55522.1 Tetratricopeptide TPR_2 repeat protein [Mesorhizobium prunaredense]
MAESRKALLHLVLGFFIAFSISGHASAAETSLPAPDPQIAIHDGFVDEKKCASCHADQVAAFVKSNHARAMAVADDSTVRANFDDASFEHDGILTAFFKRGGQYFVRTEGPDGKEGEFQVKYTFAYEPLQQYLIDIGGGRLQALDIAWDTNKREWFWLGAGKPAKPGTTYHWTGPFYRWNRTCIDCHSTDPQANFQPEIGEYKSTYVATSIGCQSCHGSGAKHVDWAEAGASQSLSNFGLAPADQNVCLGCHSRRTKLLNGHGPGRAFLDHFSPSLLRPDLYFPDGQILDEVFEYGSFQQSKMARAGVVCLDCHKQHEATLKADGNAVCTQCHAETKPERFTNFDPSGSFDTPAHTHHPAGAAGALCANCHMPQRAYMKVDPRRDHSFVIPRPDLSIAYGTPNACTTCHATQTNAWAAETMDEWYGTAWRERPTIAHAFAGAAQNDPAAIEALRALVADREQAGIVKGSAIVEMGRLGGDAVFADVAAAAASPDPLVRLGAAQAAGSLPPELRLNAIGKLLADETRAVRVATVTALGNAPTADLLGDQRRSFHVALEDLRAYVQANADMAEAQNAYGLFLMGQRQADEAEAALRRAISLDGSLAGAHANLAELYRATGQNEKSESTYAEAIKISPEDPLLRYGHALSLVREKDLTGAIEELERSVRLAPANAQYRTTLAIALDSAGRPDDAFASLDEAVAGGVADADLLSAAIQIGLKLRRYQETLKHAEALALLRPDDPQIAELVRQLRDTAQTGN